MVHLDLTARDQGGIESGCALDQAAWGSIFLQEARKVPSAG